MKKAFIVAIGFLMISGAVHASQEIQGRKAQRIYQALEVLSDAKILDIEPSGLNSNESDSEDSQAYAHMTTLEIEGKVSCTENMMMSTKKKTATTYSCILGQ